jgi:hypothetical protein
MGRETCLYCEQEGKRTVLVQTPRGGCCPIHSAAFLAALERNARALLGIPKPQLRSRGIPTRR